METPPDDWPYADEPTACAVCGTDDDRHITVESLGLVWGGAMDGGLPPTDVGDYSGTFEFRVCHDCWLSESINALEEAQTLVAREGRGRSGRPLALDNEKTAAAAKLDAERVAIATFRPLEFRSDPEREHVRSQDEAVESLLEAWFACE
ncbi:hypothetical protein [Halorussus lipolyticus]|uniref:hypothetical protein n=1 Tax=Halorussus lipolyticus TaxID=3034024 RepID=UPI0023E774E7|nr:hypothetical protein [Halorussus sp. DT80]